jgi:hypothetical protein
MLSIAKWQALISGHLIVVYLWTQNLLSVCYLSTFWMIARFECTVLENVYGPLALFC